MIEHFIAIYLLLGIVWGLFAMYVQLVEKGKSKGILKTGLIHGICWPVSIFKNIANGLFGGL